MTILAVFRSLCQIRSFPKVLPLPDFEWLLKKHPTATGGHRAAHGTGGILVDDERGRSRV